MADAYHDQPNVYIKIFLPNNPLRRQRRVTPRADTEKSEGFFDATQEATPDVTLLHMELLAADEEKMLQDLERLDEAHVSFTEEEKENSHPVQSPMLAFDRTNEVPAQVEATTPWIPDPMTPGVLLAQSEAAITSVATATPTQRFEDHRVIRPGGLASSKYAEAPASAVAPPSGPSPSISASTANRSSAKRQLFEHENEGPARCMEAQSAKRMRSTHSREPTGDRSSAVRRSYPSTWNRYEWALINDNIRNGQNPAIFFDREKTPGQSHADPTIIDEEPTIKQEFLFDEHHMNPPANPPTLSYPIPRTPAYSIPPCINQSSIGLRAAQGTIPQVHHLASDHVDLMAWCIPPPRPNIIHRQPTMDEQRLLEDLGRKVNRILRGEKDRADIKSRLPAWMRNGLSKEQKEGISIIQKRIRAKQRKAKASQSKNQHRAVKGKGANATPLGSKQVSMKDMSAPVMQNQQWIPLTVATTPLQTQPSTPQQTLPPYGLEPLDYDNLFGPALVLSALAQVNNMLEMFEVDVRCVLSGLDLIDAQKSTRNVLSSLPPGYAPLPLASLPCERLAGPSLVNHALQETNEMMRSFGLPQQFALCWKDLQQMQQ